MTVSLRLSDADAEIIRSYSEVNGISISELFRTAALEKIEGEYDLKLFQKAYENHKKDSETYSFEETAKLLDM